MKETNVCSATDTHHSLMSISSVVGLLLGDFQKTGPFSSLFQFLTTDKVQWKGENTVII